MEKMLKSFGAKLEEASAVHPGQDRQKSAEGQAAFCPLMCASCQILIIWTKTYRWRLIWHVHYRFQKHAAASFFIRLKPDFPWVSTIRIKGKSKHFFFECVFCHAGLGRVVLWCDMPCQCGQSMANYRATRDEANPRVLIGRMQLLCIASDTPATPRWTCGGQPLTVPISTHRQVPSCKSEEQPARCTAALVLAATCQAIRSALLLQLLIPYFFIILVFCS